MRAQALLVRPYGLPSLIRRGSFSSSSSSSSSSSLARPFGLCRSRTKNSSAKQIPFPFPAATKLEQVHGVSLAGSRYGAVPVRRFSGIRATQVSDSGSIDSPMIHSMEKKIKEQLNADVVIVKDAYGDGRHVSIDVVSASFEGQSAVNRQRMVYKAISEELQSTVHAVDRMTTRTPAEAVGNK